MIRHRRWKVIQTLWSVCQLRENLSGAWWSSAQPTLKNQNVCKVTGDGLLSSLRQHLCCHWLRLPNKVEAKRLNASWEHHGPPCASDKSRGQGVATASWNCGICLASDLAADFCSVEIAVATEAASFLWKWSGESSWGRDVGYSKLTCGGNGIWRILQEPFEVVLDWTLETGYLSVPYIRGPREFSHEVQRKRQPRFSCQDTHLVCILPKYLLLVLIPFWKGWEKCPFNQQHFSSCRASCVV